VADNLVLAWLMPSASHKDLKLVKNIFWLDFCFIMQRVYVCYLVSTRNMLYLQGAVVSIFINRSSIKVLLHKSS